MKKIFGKKLKEMSIKELEKHIEIQKTWTWLILGCVLALIVLIGINILITHIFTAGTAFILNLSFMALLLQILSFKWAIDELRYKEILDRVNN